MPFFPETCVGFRVQALGFVVFSLVLGAELAALRQAAEWREGTLMQVGSGCWWPLAPLV